MTDGENSRQRPHEPLLNAPPLALLLPVILVSLYGLQSLAGPEVEQSLFDSYALTPVLLRQGNFDLLITHLFLHGSWMHVIFNSFFSLAFATPVVRAFGKGFGGALSYLSFYFICGAVAGLGYCLLNWQSNVPVVGASGAISGLIGAAIRLRTDADIEDLLPIWHPRVMAMTLSWCGINALTAFLPMLTGDQGMVIAWQAHVVGYIFGLLAISPWLRLFHRHYFTTK